jgi:hypothetical protein
MNDQTTPHTEQKAELATNPPVAGNVGKNTRLPVDIVGRFCMGGQRKKEKTL